MWYSSNFPQDNTRSDVERFLALLNDQFAHYFVADSPLFVARAPGRLDLMGGIADYSGSLVLEMPLAVAALAAVQYASEPAITVCSTSATEIASEPLVSIPLASLYPEGRAPGYSAAHVLLTTDPQASWVAYVIGVLVVLQQEYQLSTERGLHVLIDCSVPIGKGVSSSAALEVAVMQAVSTLYHLTLDGREIAILCQKVENLIVGAPCGIMDQMTSACGENNSLLAILCQPAELQGSVPLPTDVEIWGLDSGVRHAISGRDYGSVRIGAFMGYRIIADMQGLAVRLCANELVEVSDEQWKGYLANIAPSLWEMHYHEHIPVALTGEAFLERYGGTTDTITHIDPARTYAVRQPTAHPIYENLRVQLFRALLTVPTIDSTTLALLGELMYQSHASYSACGLGSPGTDRLVELVRQAGPVSQLYGAKITGGGSGGTVAVLARRNSAAQIQRIAEQYERETGLKTTILCGSSPGAHAWGCLEINFL